MAVRQLFRISVMLVLLYKAVTQQCTGGESEKSIVGWMLQRHIYKTMLAELPFTCLFVCRQDDRCQSFNWVFSRLMCEFNNRTKEARPEDFVLNPERSYFRKDKNRVPLGSISELPAETCDEMKKSEGIAVGGKKYWFSTIKTGTSILAYCDVETDECQSYQSLNSADRKITYMTYHGYCDDKITPGWYRFEGAAGTRMPTSCPPQIRCGTHATSWLTGGHPTVADGIVTRRICFSWGGICCYKLQNHYIQVRNCGSYYVYKLIQTGLCHYRYCGTD